MNSENLNRVADAIEKHIFDLGYDQRDFLNHDSPEDIGPHNCETTACLCGWARAVQLTNIPSQFEASDTWEAAQYLGLDIFEARELFRASPFKNNETPTQAHAIRVLRHAAQHHVIDWEATR